MRPHDTAGTYNHDDTSNLLAVVQAVRQDSADIVAACYCTCLKNPTKGRQYGPKWVLFLPATLARHEPGIFLIDNYCSLWRSTKLGLVELPVWYVQHLPRNGQMWHGQQHDPNSTFQLDKLSLVTLLSNARASSQ